MNLINFGINCNMTKCGKSENTFRMQCTNIKISFRAILINKILVLIVKYNDIFSGNNNLFVKY